MAIDCILCILSIHPEYTMYHGIPLSRSTCNVRQDEAHVSVLRTDHSILRNHITWFTISSTLLSYISRLVTDLCVK